MSSSIADTDTWVTGHGFAELGHVLRLRGRRNKAAEAYARALRAGVDPEPGPACSPQPKAGGPRASTPSALRSRHVLPCSGWRSCCLRSSSRSTPGSTSSAWIRRRALRRRRQARRRGAQAWAWHARALIELEAARPHAAADAARTASDLYRSQHLQYGLARAHKVLARAERDLGRQEEAAADAATALAIYRRLGATSDAARLEAATGARGVGPLTPREAQVLAHVLGGASNRAIADASS